MQKYPRSLVRQIEKANCTFWFEFLNGRHTANIKDKDTGEVLVTVADDNELTALTKAAAMVENRPKKMNDREMARKIAELEAKLAAKPDEPVVENKTGGRRAAKTETEAAS